MNSFLGEIHTAQNVPGRPVYAVVARLLRNELLTPIP